MPKVSIITPVLNGGKRFKKCIDSVLRQSMDDYEWIIIDDKSTDGTAELIKDLCKRDKRIVSLFNSETIGASLSRQRGIEVCSGDYLTFLDADDALTPSALQDYIHATNDCNADIYITGTRLIMPLGLKLVFYSGERDPHLSSGVIEGKKGCLLVMSNQGLTPHLWDKMYSTTFFLQTYREFPDLKVGEDFLLNIRLMAKADKICRVSSIGYLWTYTGMGSKYYLTGWPDYQKSISLAINEIPSLDMSVTEQAEATHALFSNYINHIKESIILRGFRGDRQSEIADFIDNALKHEILHLAEGENPPSRQEMLKSAAEYLREHRKYYTFTRIINRFLK